MLDLSKHVDAITERWHREVAREVSVPSQTFRDRIPSLIDALAAWLDGRDAHARETFREVVEAHVVERHRARSTFAELTAEYTTLRAAVLAVVLASSERDQLAPAVVALSNAFDVLIKQAIARFDLECERIRERFVSMLVHDLRDPLTAVMMSANLLADMTLGERQAQMVGRITRGARRIERMVDEVVDVARTSIGDGIAITLESVDLGEVCNEAIGEARAVPSPREIVLEVAGDLHGAWDRERVRQAMSSLIYNATQSGQGPIRVRAEERPDHRAVVTTVTSRGPVLSPELLARIFDPFARVQLDAVRVRGLGLGLYLVDQIARAHGGSATAASSSEHGTVLTVEWPRRA